MESFTALQRVIFLCFAKIYNPFRVMMDYNKIQKVLKHGIRESVMLGADNWTQGGAPGVYQRGVCVIGP